MGQHKSTNQGLSKVASQALAGASELKLSPRNKTTDNGPLSHTDSDLVIDPFTGLEIHEAEYGNR